jgi:hypothetical protein
MRATAESELKEVQSVELCYEVHVNEPSSLEQLEDVFSIAKTGIKQALTDLHDPQWVVICLTHLKLEQYRVTIVHQALPSVKYGILKFRDIRFSKPCRSYRSESFEYFKNKLNDIQSRFMSVYDSGRWRSVCVREGYKGQEVKPCDAR